MSIETMKQALEVLEYHVEHFDSEQYTSICELDPAKDAITSLRQAIAEAEQEQGEPVAWVIWFCGYPAGFFEKETDAIEAFEQRNLDYPEESRKLLPLYTTPQQRTWVGLTNEERLKLYRQFEDYLKSDGWEYEKAIEAELKDKNL